MGGRFLHVPETHTCVPPLDALLGSVWQCDCTLVWVLERTSHTGIMQWRLASPAEADTWIQKWHRANTTRPCDA